MTPSSPTPLLPRRTSCTSSRALRKEMSREENVSNHFSNNLLPKMSPDSVKKSLQTSGCCLLQQLSMGTFKTEHFNVTLLATFA